MSHTTATVPATTLATQLLDMHGQLAAMLPADVLSALDAYAERLGRERYPAALRAGSVAPQFVLPDHRGQAVSLRRLLEQGPVVVTFYRGHWCPYCNTQLHAYQEMLPDLIARSAQLVAISPQTPDNSLTTAERHALAFPVLSDVGSRVADQFGITLSIEDAMRDLHAGVGADLTVINGDSSWRVPVPATYVIKPDGAIAADWIDGDFRHRAEPAEILAALDAIRIR
jgi:peroxiredoxin